MDEFTITIPRKREFGTVAGLVVGGVAARHELTLDVLDDLQLALDALLDRVGTDGADVTIVLKLDVGSIGMSVGPLPADVTTALDGDAGSGIDLKRVLGAVVDEVGVAARDGGSWVELRKSYALAGSGT
ncbi:MAG TPA: hypothetical protein VIA10_18605 [Gaiellaceae bacterium]